MSRSGWLKHPKARLAAVLLTVCAGLIFGLSVVAEGLSRDANYQREADDYGRKYAAHTEQQIRQECIRLPDKAKSNCIAEKRHEYRKDEREERDLVAQRKSANWAYIMGSAAVLGMVLSAIGVVLVWTTFQATKEANLIAATTQFFELRPYVFLDQATFGHEVKSKDGTTRRVLLDPSPVALTIKNFGSTPAKNVKLVARAFVGGVWNAPFETQLGDAAEIPLGDIPPGQSTPRDGFFVSSSQPSRAAMSDGEMSLFIEGCITYENSQGSGFETKFRWASTHYDFIAYRFNPCPDGNSYT